MKEPRSNNKTMKQLMATKKMSKRNRKWYWQGRIDGLKGRPAYVKWLSQQKKRKL